MVNFEFLSWFHGRTNCPYFKISVTCALLGLTIAATGPAHAVTYNLGGGTSLGVIVDAGNDPAPNSLICSAANDVCNTKKGTFEGTYTGSEDINSVNLFKHEENDTYLPNARYSVSETTQTSGSWTQIWQGVANELITHYVAIKASTEYHLIGYDLSLITATLMTGDIITGTWTVGTIPHDMSHVSLYNSSPAVIPIPAALPLFGTALLGMGVLSRRRRKVRAAA